MAEVTARWLLVKDALCRSHGAALSDRPGRQGLRAAVVRTGLVSRRFGVLLNLRPGNLPPDAVNGDGKGDPGTRYAVVMSLGAVGCAVVVNEGPGRRCACGCPAGPVQPFNQHAVVGARQHDLRRLNARPRAVAIHLDASVDPGHGRRGRDRRSRGGDDTSGHRGSRRCRAGRRRTGRGCRRAGRGCRRAGGGAASRRHDCQAGTGDRRDDPPAPDPDFTAYVHTLKTLADPGWLHPMATTSQPTGRQGTCLTSPTICNPGH